MLLGQRGKPPFAGLYSLPGGAIEAGESAEEAALRELFEETGVEAEIAGRLAEIEAAAGDVYRVAAFYGLWRRGEPRAGGDCAAVCWAALDALGGYALTDGTESLIRRAAALLGIENG